jgi:hypothetical protein
MYCTVVTNSDFLYLRSPTLVMGLTLLTGTVNIRLVVLCDSAWFLRRFCLRWDICSCGLWKIDSTNLTATKNLISCFSKIDIILFWDIDPIDTSVSDPTPYASPKTLQPSCFNFLVFQLCTFESLLFLTQYLCLSKKPTTLLQLSCFSLKKELTFDSLLLLDNSQTER